MSKVTMRWYLFKHCMTATATTAAAAAAGFSVK